MVGNTRQKPKDNVERAFEQGQLFAHMFEFNTENGAGYDARDDASFEKLCDVLNGDSTAEYKTSEHHVNGKPEGFVGIASTAMKKGLPVQLWNVESNFGLLFNGLDKQHVTPLMVGSGDMTSHARNHGIAYEYPHLLPELTAIQKPSRHDEKQTHITDDPVVFRLPRDQQQMAQQAEKALPAFWESIEKMGWDKYLDRQALFKGVNEVTLAAQLKGVAGIVVNKARNRFSAIEAVTDRDMVQAVRDAREFRKWLCEKHPESFPKPPPIYVYDAQRTQQPLVKLSEAQLRKPESCVDITGRENSVAAR